MQISLMSFLIKFIVRVVKPPPLAVGSVNNPRASKQKGVHPLKGSSSYELDPCLKTVSYSSSQSAGRTMISSALQPNRAISSLT